MERFDVVIIGAGLAGLQCARLLSRSGRKVLLVDRKTDLTRGIHTTGIFVRKTFEDFDFPAGTLGPPIRDVTLYSPKLRKLCLSSEKDEFRIGKMDSLYGAYLQECLDNGATFAGGTRYAGCAKRAKKKGGPRDKRAADVIVRLEKGGRSYGVKTKVLVGADGVVSRVARDLGLDQNGEWIVGYEEVFQGVPAKGEPRLHCFLDARLAPGYLAWAADDGEEIHIGVGGYPSGFDPREALKMFKQKIIGNFFDLNRAELSGTRGGLIPVGGVLQRIASTHGLLIGDAAGAVSPLTAGGLDPCLRLSAIASRVIAESLQKNDPRILCQYSGGLFRSRFISRLWMRRIVAHLTNQQILELGCAFLRRNVGRKLARHVFFGRGSFPDVRLVRLSPRENLPVI